MQQAILLYTHCCYGVEMFWYHMLSKTPWLGANLMTDNDKRKMRVVLYKNLFVIFHHLCYYLFFLLLV